MVKAHYGDVIAIINASEGSDYKVGDVFEVDMRASYMGACDDDTLMTTCGKVIMDDEYEILEYNSTVHAEDIVREYLSKNNGQLLSEFKWGGEGEGSFSKFMNNLRRVLANKI